MELSHRLAMEPQSLMARLWKRMKAHGAETRARRPHLVKMLLALGWARFVRACPILCPGQYPVPTPKSLALVRERLIKTAHRRDLFARAVQWSLAPSTGTADAIHQTIVSSNGLINLGRNRNMIRNLGRNLNRNLNRHLDRNRNTIQNPILLGAARPLPRGPEIREAA
jgi:hypothetical protein